MAVDFRRIISGILSAVESITPATWADQGFSAPDLSLPIDPEDWIARPTRRFRQCVLHSIGDPYSTKAYCYAVWDLELLIYYPRSIATDELAVIMLEDVLAVQQKLGRHPELWGGAESLSFLEQQPNTAQIIVDDNGMGIAVVKAVPMRLVIPA